MDLKRHRFSASWLLFVALCQPSASDLVAQDRYAEARDRLVNDRIKTAGVTDTRVLNAIRSTMRHEFVPKSQRDRAYFDMALPIGNSQTISSPFIVALMTEALDPQPTDKVLEIGTGSGYQAAVLSPLVEHVYTIEIVADSGRTCRGDAATAGLSKCFDPRSATGFSVGPRLHRSTRSSSRAVPNRFRSRWLNNFAKVVR